MCRMESKMKAPEALIRACQIPVDENGDPCVTTDFLTNLKIEATRAYADTYDSEMDKIVSDALVLYGGVLKPEDGWEYFLDEMSGAVNIRRRETDANMTVSIYDEGISVRICEPNDFNVSVAFDFEKCGPEEMKKRLVFGLKWISEMCEGISI